MIPELHDQSMRSCDPKPLLVTIWFPTQHFRTEQTISKVESASLSSLARKYPELRRRSMSGCHLTESCFPIGKLPSGVCAACKVHLVGCVYHSKLKTNSGEATCLRSVSGYTTYVLSLWVSIRSRMCICHDGQRTHNRKRYSRISRVCCSQISEHWIGLQITIPT